MAATAKATTVAIRKIAGLVLARLEARPPSLATNEVTHARRPESAMAIATPSRADFSLVNSPCSPLRLAAASLADVPVALRRDSSLVVERFLPEFEDGLYHMRLYQFLGDQESCARMGAKDPVVNAATHCRHEAVEPHPAIVELRHAMHFDYGKFDYVIHDGQAILLDINKTVGTGGLERTPERVRLVRLRAQGICKYLE